MEAAELQAIGQNMQTVLLLLPEYIMNLEKEQIGITICQPIQVHWKAAELLLNQKEVQITVMRCLEIFSLSGGTDLDQEILITLEFMLEKMRTGYPGISIAAAVLITQTCHLQGKGLVEELF